MTHPTRPSILYIRPGTYRDTEHGKRYMARLNAQPAWNPESRPRYGILSSTSIDRASNRRQGSPRRVMHDSGEVFASVAECAKAYRISPNTVTKSIQHDVPTHAGQFYILPEAEYQQIMAEKGMVAA